LQSTTDLDDHIVLIASARLSAALRRSSLTRIIANTRAPAPTISGGGSKGAVSELDALVTDRNPTIGVIDDRGPLADRRLCLLARLKNERMNITLLY
jgi:hypothetical protein